MSTPNPVNQLRGRLGQLVATKAPAGKIAEVRAELAEAELEQRIARDQPRPEARRLLTRPLPR